MKQVILRLVDGSLEKQEFKAILDIQDILNVRNLNRPIFSSPIHLEGKLPSNPKLANYLLQFWEEDYRSLYPRSRAIKPEKTTVTKSRLQLIENCRQSAPHLISLFNEWLDSKTFKNIYTCLLRELKQDDVIQFLICTNDIQIQKLPWHEWSLIKDYFPNAEVAISPPEYKLPKYRKTRSSGMRVLAILGGSSGINTKFDLEKLEELPNIDLHPLVEPKRSEINDKLWQQPWDIIFFAGHGKTEEDIGRIYINPNEYLTIKELEYALRETVKRGLKLAVFNSCDGLGLVRQLNERQIYIPQVIVMRDLIPDKAAHEFLKYFLEAFSKKNKSFHLAVREAREKLQGREDEYPCATWLPVVCQHPETVSLTWRQQRDSLSHVLNISTLAAISVIAIRSLGLLEGMELKAYDNLMRLRPPEEPDPRLLLVRVTDNDIKQPNQKDSLSNQDLDKALRKLSKYEPRFIGLDIYRDSPFEKNQTSFKTYLEQNRLITVCQQESEEFREIPPPPDITKQPG